jgi:uncharacterized protein (TIGR02147 family)
MPDLYSFDDYRLFLKQYQEERKVKHAWYSNRYMASKIGIDPGYFVKILQGKAPLPERFVEPLCELLGFGKKEQVYFLELVAFSRAKGAKQIQESYQKLLAMRDVELHTLERDQYEYYSHWHHTAIRAISEILDFRDDYALLGNSLTPPITAKMAKTSVELLARLGLLAKNGNGSWRPAQQFITSGAAWKSSAVRSFQQEMFRLAIESVDRHEPAVRDMSTLTITLKEKDIPEVQARVAQFRKELLQWIGEQKDEDMVVQVNLQVFPLSLPRRTS